MDTFNGVKLVGDVIAIEGDHIVIETRAQSFDAATGEEREYAHRHEVVVPMTAALEKIKQGIRVALFGSLAIVDGRAVVMADPATVKRAPKGAEFVNLAKLIGQTASAFRYFARNAGRQSFGNLLVQAGSDRFWTKLFGAAADTWSRIVKKGATVQIQGRLQSREFTTRDGELAQITELIADPDQSRILVLPEAKNEFDGWTPQSTAGGEGGTGGATEKSEEDAPVV